MIQGPQSLTFCRCRGRFYTDLKSSRNVDIQLYSRTMKNRYWIILFFALFAQQTMAQVNVRDSITAAWMFSFNLSGHLVSGDAGDQYANALGLGMDIEKRTRTNWLFGVDGTYMFGSEVNNVFDIFGHLATEQGFILGLNGQYATVEFLYRGFNVGGHVGKLFNIMGPNPNSGLLVKLGAGYVQNKIFIRAPGTDIPQIQGEYAKGYDRLHEGLAIKQYVGYMHSGNSRTVNFQVGFEFMQGFTKNVRGFNYDTGMPDNAQKLDLYFGIKASWVLPIYDKNQQKFYYY